MHRPLLPPPHPEASAIPLSFRRVGDAMSVGTKAAERKATVCVYCGASIEEHEFNLTVCDRCDAELDRMMVQSLEIDTLHTEVLINRAEHELAYLDLI